MLLQPVGWDIVVIVSLKIGVAVTRKTSSNTAEFFAAGRSMPWQHVLNYYGALL